ncbi:hypothetical protein Egran_06661 [Elaphomyces granulatus]|uniref:tRNA (adenine(58)-N(1))-methyltransferase catalytic subunit TRM61 n=1 Tax=Elaphomyces granulatus TaxID=519963 RepID=A0A232LN31_9EURO|nr:hypothetical protein Egran_06661 [Elaphomyces granulatus]
MDRLRQFIGRALGFSPPKAFRYFTPSVDTNFSIFREGDRAIVLSKNPLLTKPLTKGHQTDVRRGALQHDNIIGKRVRDPIQAYKGPEYRLSLPTLEEYVLYTPRLVTPIYAADANLIVSLLDIHVFPPTEGEKRTPLEILEAGTGHGSLTLHLARAIQAANSNPPPLPTRSQVQILLDRSIRPHAEAEVRGFETDSGALDGNPIQQQWDTWRATRGAVIHTVDVSAKFSAHAEKIVRGFRRGIYAGNVDFHVGHVEDWIAEQMRRRQTTGGLLSLQKPKKAEPFLSYAILDMPSAHLRIPHVTPILRRDGLLAVFMPSVTQIGDCVQLIRQQRLPFILERAVELGMGLSSGRLWDVRFALKKSRADPSSWVEKTATESSNYQEDHADDLCQHIGADDTLLTSEDLPKEDNSVLVCRPKVGQRIVGGGFIGIWRRIEDRSDEGRSSDP